MINGLLACQEHLLVKLTGHDLRTRGLLSDFLSFATLNGPFSGAIFRDKMSGSAEIT